jgi:signal transduction histidine kinase
LNGARHVFPLTARRSRTAFLAVIVLILFGAQNGPAQTAASGENSRPKRVLMIFGEGKDVPGNVMLEQAVRAEMQKLSTNRIEFFGENLDASHFSDASHYLLFQDYLGRKYAGQNLDLLLVFPSRDYTLAEELPAAVFPGLPVVLVAANEMAVPPDLGKHGITGIIQRFDLRGTLGLILRLQPETRRVVVIGGTSDMDRATLGRIEEVARSLDGIEFDFWTNRPVAELPVAVKSLPEDTVILLSTVQRDVAGLPFFMSQLASMLAPAANAPMYVLGGWVLGSGALGGAVVDPNDLGARAGKLALQVLEGTPADKLPVDVPTKGTPTVDWRALRRWDISESRVPAGCVVRYRPHSLWEEHQSLILFSLALFLAQAGTIAGLLAQRAQRRRAEAEILIQRTELAHVARVSTMGQLSSALTHELNQPLGAILRNAEAAEIFLQREPPDLDEVRAILADIRKDDQRAGSVIDRMRTLLKRHRLESNPLDLAGLLEETVTLTRADAQARRVNLALQVPAPLPVVHGDRVHLQQVLLNLILNGMDAMADGPPAERLLTVRAEVTQDGNVEITVGDCGTGIPSDKMKFLFEPFFTTKPNGMGMGLAISQTIIEAHNGKIRAGNNAGKGATFTITLPAKSK